MICAMYLRKSRSDNPSEDIEETLSRHRQILEEYAKNKKLIIKEIYSEVASGDSLAARPQMLLLLQAVEEGEYDAVICLDIDRLGRGGMREQGIILETFKFSATLIMTPEKTYDLSNDLDEQATEFKTFISRQEYKSITKRLRRGIMASVNEGAYLSNAPFGYTKIKQGKLSTLEPNPEEAPHVVKIFDMYVNDKIGSYGIANYLNSIGVKPPRNDTFSRNTVRLILKNPLYIGKISWNKVTRKRTPDGSFKSTNHPPSQWLTVDGLHPPLISTEIFNRAQEIRTNRHAAPIGKKDMTNPLCGVIQCKTCGKNIQLTTTKGKWYYMWCTKNNCVGSTHLETLENMLLLTISKRLAEIKANPPKSVDNAKLITQLKKALTGHKAQKDKLMSFLEQGIYSVSEYQERNALLVEKIKSTESALEKAELEVKAIDLEEIERNITNALQVYHGSEVRTKNNLLKSIVKSATYHRNKGKEQPIYLDVSLIGIDD